MKNFHHKLSIKSVGANNEMIFGAYQKLKRLTLTKKNMLSDDEKNFIIYWEKRRLSEKKTMRQWLVGLPLGLLFAIPIGINFFSSWYKRANMVLNSQISNRDFNPLVLIIALLLIVSFIAIFSKRHNWEMKEQKYRELKARDDIKEN
jgi:hypothetical protein